jgi:hypothetical protein
MLLLADEEEAGRLHAPNGTIAPAPMRVTARRLVNFLRLMLAF